MIFFTDNNGTIIKSLPSPVYQGAADTNNIYLVAPFASTLQFAVAFILPKTNVYTERYLMTRNGELPDVEYVPTGDKYSIWTMRIPNNITVRYGTVTAQFFTYGTDGSITPTSATTFTVSKGVPEILPDTPSQDIYNQIITELSKLSSEIANIDQVNPLIELDSSSSSGTLTEEQQAVYAAAAQVVSFKRGEEIYSYADSDGTTATYTHTEYTEAATIVSTITVTIATGAWEYATAEYPIGAGIYYLNDTHEAIDISDSQIYPNPPEGVRSLYAITSDAYFVELHYDNSDGVWTILSADPLSTVHIITLTGSSGNLTNEQLLLVKTTPQNVAFLIGTHIYHHSDYLITSVQYKYIAPEGNENDDFNYELENIFVYSITINLTTGEWTHGISQFDIPNENSITVITLTGSSGNLTDEQKTAVAANPAAFAFRNLNFIFLLSTVTETNVIYNRVEITPESEESTVISSVDLRAVNIVLETGAWSIVTESYTVPSATITYATDSDIEALFSGGGN